MKELRRFTAWNLFGSIVPGLVAIPAIGYLAKTLTTELLGALTIAWAVVGYLSVLDLGVSRAITRFIAASAQDAARAGRGVGTALFIVTATGTLAGLLIAITSPWVATGLLHVSTQAQGDVIDALRWMSLTVPAVVLTAVLQGHIEGLEHFHTLNLQRALSGASLAVAPAVGVFFGATLTNAVLGLCVARLLALILAAIVSLRACRASFWRVDRDAGRELFHFGGWLTLTNVLSSAMNYVDRFWLARAHGSSVVAFYSIPSELILRLSILPTAISRSSFPRLVSNPQGGRDVAARSQRAIALLCAPACVIGIVAASPMLRIWVGDAYAQKAAAPLRILLLGFFFSALAQMPYTRLQADGRSALCARITLSEFFPYLALLGLLTSGFGAAGAAMAWTMRVAADWMILEYFARRKLDVPA